MAFVRDLDNLVPIMTSNTAPSGYVASASSEYSATYAAYYAMNGVLPNYDAWITTSGTTTGWLRIQFPSPKIVNKYNIYPRIGYTAELDAPKDWTFQGSNNGTTWDTLDTQSNITGWDKTNANKKTFIFSNTTAYTYYRINIAANGGYGSYTAIGELELCATGQYASLIPTMTSNSAPSGYVASASSELVGDAYYAWKAADGVLSAGYSTWTTSPVGVTTGWWQIQFPVAKVVKCYSLQTQDLAGYENRGPRDFTFLGSDNGTEWTTLDSQSGITFFRSTANTFLINNNIAYKYYRLNVTANNGGNILAIGELRMFGYGKPVHRWKLTEDANDSGAGTAVNLTNNGSVTFSADGASFNAGTKFLSGTLPVSGTGTWSAWLKPSTFAQSGFALCRANGVGGEWQTLGSATTNSAFGGSFNPTIARANNTFNSTYFPPNQLVLAAFVFTTTTLKSYIGAVEVSSVSYTPSTISTSFAIGTYGGGNYDSPNWNWQGNVCDARIYDYALTASEISALVAAGPNPIAIIPNRIWKYYPNVLLSTSIGYK